MNPGGLLAGAALLADFEAIIELLKPHEYRSWPVAYLIAQLSGQPLPPRPRIYTAVEMYTDVIAVLKPHADAVPAAGTMVELMERDLKACWIPPGMGGHA